MLVAVIAGVPSATDVFSDARTGKSNVDQDTVIQLEPSLESILNLEGSRGLAGSAILHLLFKGRGKALHVLSQKLRNLGNLVGWIWMPQDSTLQHIELGADLENQERQVVNHNSVVRSLLSAGKVEGMGKGVQRRPILLRAVDRALQSFFAFKRRYPPRTHFYLVGAARCLDPRDERFGLVG
jgi:hypothetical protein